MSGEGDSHLSSSSDTAQVREGLLRSSGAVSPADFQRCTTIPLFLPQTDAYFWLLVFIACP